jgi:hypothetical protein
VKKFGLGDFWNWVREVDCRYTVFAVKAPIHEVSQAVARIYKRRQIFEDVLSNNYKESPRIICQAIPVVSVRKTPWTIIYSLPAETPEANYALALSRSLKTYILAFSGEPDCEYMSYTVVDQGEINEHVQFVGFGADTPVIFYSQLRSTPEFGWGNVDNFEYNLKIFQEFVNAFCHEQDLYVPVCYKDVLPSIDLNRPAPVMLRVAICSREKIEKANFVGDEVLL